MTVSSVLDVTITPMAKEFSSILGMKFITEDGETKYLGVNLVLNQHVSWTVAALRKLINVLETGEADIDGTMHNSGESEQHENTRKGYKEVPWPACYPV